MKYASVCSGVEAASLAWLPLGWEAAWFSEIEPFPCAVLKERFPGVPNLGDMTKITVENLENGDQRFTGGDGTACIVRGGVDLLVGGTPCQSFSVAGKREGLEGASGLAEHFVRLLREMRPRWFVWENVPGALSSRTGGQFDFNFLVSEYAKCGYSCGWRVLDAQYVRVDGYPRAVPQRRRRVFVVGHSSADWRYPASVLFEPDCLFGDTPPRRTKRENPAAGAEGGADTAESIRMRAGKPGGGKGALVSTERSLTLAAGGNDQTVIYTVHGAQTPISNDNHANALGCCNHGLENCVCVPERSRQDDVNDQWPDVRFWNGENVAGTLTVLGRWGTGGNGAGYSKELAYTQNATGVMGVCTKGNGDAFLSDVPGGGQAGQGYPAALSNATVRRLLPVEYERLMGFPDGHTLIRWKGKPESECPDAPRYKACGNSMCVNVMRWIGMRIELADRKMGNEN